MGRFIGKLIVYIGLVFLGFSVLMYFAAGPAMSIVPWLFGSGGSEVKKEIVKVSIPVWDGDSLSWDIEEVSVPDVPEDLLIASVMRMFIEKGGFSLGWIRPGGQRVIYVGRGESKGYEVVLGGDSPPFFTSEFLRQKVCEGVDILTKSLRKGKIVVYFEGVPLEAYIPCRGSVGAMVFYSRGGDLKAKWIYTGATRNTPGSFMTEILRASGDLMEIGGSKLAGIVDSVSLQGNRLTLTLKAGSWAELSDEEQGVVIADVKYAFPSVRYIEITDPDQPFPYVDQRVKAVLLRPAGVDYDVKFVDASSLSSELMGIFPDIGSLKLSPGVASVDFSKIPSREEAEAVFRSIISLTDVTQVFGSVKGEVPAFWAEPFSEDY